MSETKPGCLLSNSVVPTNYKILLHPDLEQFVFYGKVDIDIKICEPVREITLHAADLDINATEVAIWCYSKAGPIAPEEVHFDPEAETATFIFAQEIPTGNAILSIDYTGILNDKMAGFYRSKYTAADGQTKYLATTQFEATDARRALPCWDEPARKATFEVSLIAPKNLVALSNMPVMKTSAIRSFKDKDTELQLIKFDRTPVMSTYLLAFVVGEFEFIQTQTDNGTLVRVYTMPGRSEQGRFALDVGRRVLEFYNDYFAIPYPLPKLDMIAIPDIAAGAMENWGLVTYRENALLVDQKNSALAGKQRVAEVVAHELAHQWFGNLVTMEWWTNLWLNEGFATWMANFALNHLFPEWDIWTQFLSDDYTGALSLDSLRSSHPIEVPVNNPNEISQIFDAISYSKGSCVIRMIHDFLGADAFRAGLQIYLKRHAYGNAITEDLWQALAESSKQPVQKIMDTWTKQAGFPLIQVVARDDRACVLEQKRFLASGGALTADEAAQNWQIPISLEFNYKTGRPDYCKNVFSGADTYVVPTPPEINFVKINSGQVALARVNYLPEQWQALTEAIHRNQLAPADRFGVVSDALSLARAGHLSTGQLISLLSSYRNEDNYTVWMTVIGVLGALDNILEETANSIYFGAVARHTLELIAGKLGWEEIPGEPDMNKLLRSSVLGAMGHYGDHSTIAEAVARFRDHASQTRPADPNLRGAIYSIAATHSDQKMFNIVMAMYRRETFQEEKVRLLQTLGKFTDTDSIAATLQYAFSSGEVRPGDFVYALAALGSHANGRRAAWKFLTENWDNMKKKYSGGMNMLPHIITNICGGFAQAKDAEAIEKFFNDNPAPDATRAIAEVTERIRARAAWYERNRDVVTSALQSYFQT